MSDQPLVNNFVEEIAALKKQFENIRTETEEFLAAAKNLSDKGVDEAREALEAAKENWSGLVSAFESSKIAQFFSKGKKKAKAKVKKPATKKKMAAKAKKKPVAKKAAKKSKSAKKKK